MKKIFALLCLVGIVISTQSTAQMQENLLLIQMKTEYVVDDVLVMLTSFEKDVSQSLNSLDNNVKDETDYLKGLLITYENERLTKKSECAGIKTQGFNVLEEYQKLNGFVNWMIEKVAENNRKLLEYEARSCTLTLEFVEYLRNAQNTFSLIKFLRTALSNYAFPQVNAITKVLLRFNQHDNAMKSTDLLSSMLIELNATVNQINTSQYSVGHSLDKRVVSRNSEEIGKGYIDNTKDDLELDHFESGKRKNLSEVKEELFTILDDLEKLLQKALNQKIDDQIEVSQTTADYLIYLERDNERLQKELVVQQELLKQIEERVKSANGLIETCNQEYDSIVARIKETQDKQDKYVTNKQEYRDKLQIQLDQLKAIKEIYLTQIYSTGEQFKMRYDDIIDNKVIDSTAHVDDRQLTIEYDSLQNAQDLDLKVKSSVLSSEVSQEEEQ